MVRSTFVLVVMLVLGAPALARSPWTQADGAGFVQLSTYRIGPYVVRTFPVDGQRTTSAPFYSWTSWEVYRAARDRVPERSAMAAGRVARVSTVTSCRVAVARGTLLRAPTGHPDHQWAGGSRATLDA